MEDNYLVHYGVLGMKWGVHRAQRRDSKNIKKLNKFLSKEDRMSSNTSKSGMKKSAKYLKKNSKNRAKVSNDLRAKAYSDSRLFDNKLTRKKYNSINKEYTDRFAKNYTSALLKDAKIKNPSSIVYDEAYKRVRKQMKSIGM